MPKYGFFRSPTGDYGSSALVEVTVVPERVHARDLEGARVSRGIGSSSPPALAASRDRSHGVLKRRTVA
jgi:hypothetical protein